MATRGIYSIRNTKNGKRYIGSSNNIERRLMFHLSNLRGGRGSKALQAAFDEYGEDNFAIEILKVVGEGHDLRTIEEHYIWKYDTLYNGYNTRLAVSGGGYEIASSIGREAYRALEDSRKKDRTTKSAWVRQAIIDRLEREGYF